MNLIEVGVKLLQNIKMAELPEYKNITKNYRSGIERLMVTKNYLKNINAKNLTEYKYAVKEILAGTHICVI